MTGSRDRRRFELRRKVTWTWSDWEQLQMFSHLVGVQRYKRWILRQKLHSDARRTLVVSPSWSVIRLELRRSSVCEVFGEENLLEPFLLFFLLSDTEQLGRPTRPCFSPCLTPSDHLRLDVRGTQKGLGSSWISF